MGNLKGRQQKKFICKICSESCPSGWSLGGHMKLHSNSSSSKKHWEMKTDPILGDHPDRSNEMDPEAPDLCFKCKKCDKEFGSIKALFGHMKCHSSKKSMRITTPPDDNDDWETLTEVKSSYVCQAHRKRSRTKYNSMREEEIIEDEVAECLMLLSRGATAAAAKSDDQIKKGSGNDERMCKT